ncbi:MAG: NAD(P)-dependent oxidoreductase [Rubricella sp.]
MSERRFEPGIVSGRLDPAELTEAFGDLHPPLDPHEAAVTADRCYFCHDAPCITACPTAIDIPLFIRQIATGTPEAAAKTIFDQNILGGMCARVCPTETLCEEACVREAAEGKPVEIGRLQRFATDTLMRSGHHPYHRAEPTGKKVAVVGAGPAGLACAHRLAMKGHEVTVFEAKPKPGGLNEYGIAAYKTVNGFAQAEIAWLMKIGGITIEYEAMLGRDITLDALREAFDAVFLGIGLGGVNALGLKHEEAEGIQPAVEFIADLRQAGALDGIAVGRKVIVIGGGMTAIDAAVQSKLLGAEEVTLVYRRPRENMPASRYEQDLAASKGVRMVFSAAPVKLKGKKHAKGVEFARTELRDGQLRETKDRFTIEADQVLTAIGQTIVALPALGLAGGKITVDENGRTLIDGVWAGGDCAGGGEDLTVTAVAQGRDAAEDIHRALVA